MSFGAVGTMLQAQAATMAVNPTSTSNFFLTEIIIVPKTITPSGVSGGNCTWTQVGTTLTGANSNYKAAVFKGVPTATGSATATYAFTGGTPTGIDIVAQEFSVGGTWAIDGAQGNLDLSDTGAGTVTYPSLTPAGAGDLYFAYCAWIGTAVAGATSGYVYQIDAVSDSMVYNVNCTSGAQAPTHPANATAAYIGIAVLLRESSTNATVPMSGSLSAPAAQPAAQLMSLTSGAYAGSATDLTDGTGSWASTTSATGSGAGTYAVWTVV